MPRTQFGLKTLLRLMASVATVLTGWAILDLAHLATESGEVPYLTLGGMGVAYVVAFVALAKTGERL
jgi:hypothetical protein